MTLWSRFIVWNGMLIWLGVFYYGSECFPIKPSHDLIASILDDRIPFLPETAWIYQSLFFLLPIALFVQPNKQYLVRFSVGFCLLVQTFALFFWLYPTALPNPIYCDPIPWGYRYLVMAVDVHKNVFPSLHAALCIYAGAWIISAKHKKKRIYLLVTIWIILLLGSTLTTKQHILIDVVVGAVAGLIYYILAVHLKLFSKVSFSNNP